MSDIRFAVIGDCHYSTHGNYSTRDCLGAKNRLSEIIGILNKKELDFVFSMGDIGNGNDKSEIPEMLEVFNRSVHPVKFAIGNHDLCCYNETEVSKLFAIPSPFYEFELANYHFIVLNPFEQSIYCPKDSEEYNTYQEFRRKKPWLKVQDWPGILKEKAWEWLNKKLLESQEKEQNVILFCHVPINGFGEENPARLPEFQRMFDLLDKFPNVRSYIAGHCHGGDISVRKNVLHKTVKSVCDNPQPTACIFEVSEDKIKVTGIGAETDFTHYFEEAPSHISGTAPYGSYIMTNCGDIAKTDENGCFSLPVPCRGIYSLKAVMDGCNDVYVPYTKAPADGIAIKFTPNPHRKLYTGKVDGYALLHIKDGENPVRWFDIAGTEYGSVIPETPMWHEDCPNFWAKDFYAFTAENDVSIRVLPKHKKLHKLGWYKGDLHAHLIHGENLYIGNVQESAFIGRCENYDWLYLASYHGNDGYPTDSHSLCKKLSSSDFLCRINTEFPKSRSNHFGNCCCEPVFESVDTTLISSLELADEFVWQRGGVTVPVHPFSGHMSFREMPLWLLTAPEKVPCIDFFYHDKFPREMAEKYWFALLNRGYEIGCFSTSDASFDVGRTPENNRGATYLYMKELSEENIKDAILKRHTMVTWDRSAVLFSIDDAISGDKLVSDGKERTLKVTAFWQKDRSGILRIIRNGEDIKQIPVSFVEDEEEFTFEMPVCEAENCWYSVILETGDRIRSVASPIFFRNEDFIPPEVVKISKDFPPELLSECEKLTPEELAKPELIDYFKDKLKALSK